MNGRRCQEMQLVRLAIKQEHQHFQDLGVVDKDYPDFFYLLNRKVNSLSLRGYFAKKLLDYITEEYSSVDADALSDLFPGKIPFVLEVVITIQYYHNQILDGKGGVKTPDSIKQNLLLSNLLKDQLYSYIEARFEREQARIVAAFVRNMFRYTDIGQLIEKKHNTYRAYTSDAERSLPFKGVLHTILRRECVDFLLDSASGGLPGKSHDAAFLEMYFTRIYLVSATLFKLACQMIKELAGVQEPEDGRFNLEKFSEYYGIMLQLVNDNCDWIPSKYQHRTVAKNFSDSFCDLRNGNITFPMFVHLQRTNGTSSVRKFLNEERVELPGHLQDEVYEEILESGAMKEAIRLGKETGRKALSYLNPENSSWMIFEDMVKISHFNRYYYHFYEEMRNYQIKMN